MLNLRLHIEKQAFLLLKYDFDAEFIIVKACIRALKRLLEKASDRAFRSATFFTFFLALRYSLFKLICLVAFDLGDLVELKPFQLWLDKALIGILLLDRKRGLLAEVQDHLPLVRSSIMESMNVLDYLFDLPHNSFFSVINRAETHRLKRIVTHSCKLV